MQPIRKAPGNTNESYYTVQPATKKRRDLYDGVTKEWKTVILQTKGDKSLILNGTNFCKAWTLIEAIRDLMQNAIDSMLKNHRSQHKDCMCSITVESPPSTWKASQNMIQKFYVMSPDGRLGEERGFLSWDQSSADSGPILTIANRNASFSPSALSIGCSTKGEFDAGGHGEGLKAAATVICRENVQFEIFQSSVATQFSKKRYITYQTFLATSKKLAFQRKNAELCKVMKVSAKNDVIIHLGHSKALQLQYVQKAAECFLFFTHRPIQEIALPLKPNGFLGVRVQQTPSGRAILMGQALSAKIYVRDIFFEVKQAGQKKWGVNLIKTDAPNRDRNLISSDNYTHAVGKLISDCIDTHADFAEEIIEEFEEAMHDTHAVDHMRGLAKVASELTKARLLEAYTKRPNNQNVPYIFPETSRDRGENEATIVRWCDMQACQIVHPILYELIQDGYPSFDMIKKQCSEKLLRCSPNKVETDLLKMWLKMNAHLLVEQPNRSHSNNLVYDVQVFDSLDYLDVPLFVITEHIVDPLHRYPVIVFSNRALQLKKESEFAFLQLVRDAVQSVAASIDSVSVDRMLWDASIQLKPTPCENPQVSSDFDNNHVSVDRLGVDDEAKQLADLLSSLHHTVVFENYTIDSTQQAMATWNNLVVQNKSELFFLTNESIRICRLALDVLNHERTCTLHFYLSQESNVAGFASRTQGIHINLRSILLHVGAGNRPDVSKMWSYFTVLMAHEYAHFVHDTDGHSPSHARRTEQYMRQLMQAGYTFPCKRLA